MCFIQAFCNYIRLIPVTMYVCCVSIIKSVHYISLCIIIIWPQTSSRRCVSVCSRSLSTHSIRCSYNVRNSKYITNTAFYCHNWNIISITVNCQSFELQPFCKVIIKMFMATKLFDGSKDKLRKQFFLFSGKITANCTWAKPIWTEFAFWNGDFSCDSIFTLF